MKGLRDRVAVIAGGGGIGGACARRLAAEGAPVVIADHDGASAHATADEITTAGGRAIGLEFDISDEQSVTEVFDKTRSHFGSVDLLHANAAAFAADEFFADVDALEAPMSVFDRVMSVNLRGYLLCTRAALPMMLTSGGGAIVYTASTAAVVPSQKAFYAASKAGVITLMRHVALKWGKQGIRANVVAPGFILTPSALAKESDESVAKHLARLPHTRMGEAGDISATVAFLLSDEAGYLQGQVIHVNGGAYMT